MAPQYDRVDKASVFPGSVLDATYYRPSMPRHIRDCVCELCRMSLDDNASTINGRPASEVQSMCEYSKTALLATALRFAWSVHFLLEEFLPQVLTACIYLQGHVSILALEANTWKFEEGTTNICRQGLERIVHTWLVASMKSAPGHMYWVQSALITSIFLRTFIVESACRWAVTI